MVSLVRLYINDENVFDMAMIFLSTRCFLSL
jgi:hypothetical protein